MKINPFDIFGPLKVRMHHWSGHRGYLACLLRRPKYYAAGKTRLESISNLAKLLAKSE
jgi:hypothetical protein